MPAIDSALIGRRITSTTYGGEDGNITQIMLDLNDGTTVNFPLSGPLRFYPPRLKPAKPAEIVGFGCVPLRREGGIDWDDDPQVRERQLSAHTARLREEAGLPATAPAKSK